METHGVRISVMVDKKGHSWVRADALRMMGKHFRQLSKQADTAKARF